jgi:hypothetical protein
MTTKRKTASGRPKTNKKYFTIEEARRALPYVSRIVSDITACYGQVLDIRQRLEMPRPEDLNEQLKSEYDGGMAKLNGLIDELQQVGVELKDFERGLIDFPAWHDGREICLCWHQGEASISAWHEVDAGFAGRQDVTLLEPVGAGSGEAGDDSDAAN